MKCPVCGTDNKTMHIACYRCGTKLAEEHPQPKGHANSLWSRSTEQKNRDNTPPFWSDTKGKPNYENKGDFVVLNDEESQVHIAHDLLEQGAPVPDNKQKLERIKNGREIHVVVPPAPPRARRSAKQRRYRVNWRRFIVATVIILLASAGLSYGGYMAYKSGLGALSQWFASQRGTEPLTTPLVEKIMIDGLIWHKITFYGKDGEQVLVQEPRRSMPIQNGKAELLLDDQSYIPDDLTSSDSKRTIELKATIYSPNNKERTVTVPSYTIDIPLSPLKIILPEEQAIETASNRITVKVKVTPGSRVLVGSDNATDRVSPDGYVTSTVDLEPKGMNIIKITVETKKHRKNLYELQVNHPVLDVPIVLDNDTVAKTSDPTVVIKGSTAPGATITTDAPVKNEIQLNKSTGTFRFTAQLKLWGWNTIAITATQSNGKTSTLKYLVNHDPALESYTKKAWEIDYDSLTASTDTLIGQVYLCHGMVMKKLENDESEYYLVNLGNANQSKLVVIEYAKESGLKVGQYYKMFADVTGTYESYPVLNGRFAYEQDTPADYGQIDKTSDQTTAPDDNEQDEE